MLLVFDLDGTLVDSRLDIAASCNAALLALGRKALPAEVVAGFVGDGARKLIARALEMDATEPLVDRGLEAFIDFYLAHPVVHTTWMAGALEALSLAPKHTLALATNKRTSVALAIVRALGAEESFAAITGGGDGPLKPDPASIRRVVQETGYVGDPRSVWMIGDGPQDVLAGKAFGATTVAVQGGFHSEAKLRDASPDHLLVTLEELPALLE
jgi:phosphoglycolate phosphatase-like HAD superfamily hydrolase